MNDMTLQEREIELKYLNKIIKRLEERGDSIYKNSPVYKSNQYVWEASAAGNYDRSVEAELEIKANEWRKSEEAKEYEALVERLGKFLTVRGELEKAQENYVLEKYKL